MVASVIVLALTATSCSTGSSCPRVVMIGNSITLLARPAIGRTLDPVYDVGYVFRVGVRIDQMVGLVGSDLQDNGPTSAAVIELGTNDAIQGVASTRALASLDRLLATTASVRCVVLTTVNSSADVRGGGDVAAALNERMRLLAAADPRRYKVVDWNAFVHSLGPGPFSGYLQADRTHETALGAEWIAASDAAALHTCGTTKPAPLLPAAGR